MLGAIYLRSETVKPIEPLDVAEQMQLRRTIGQRCRRSRVRLGLSQRALARAMGRSPSWVREIERGDQYAPPYLLKALAVATGYSVGWHYGEDGPDEAALVQRVFDALRAAGERSLPRAEDASPPP